MVFFTFRFGSKGLLARREFEQEGSFSLVMETSKGLSKYDGVFFCWF